MKAQIIISGQISGNYTLSGAIDTINAEVSRTNFYGFKFVYNSMQEARTALKNAYKELKAEEPDFYNGGGISLYNDILGYDASRAKLSKLY